MVWYHVGRPQVFEAHGGYRKCVTRMKNETESEQKTPPSHRAGGLTKANVTPVRGKSSSPTLQRVGL